MYLSCVYSVKMNFWLILSLLAIVCKICSSSRILVLAPFSGKSHYLQIKVITAELAERGHDVTAITSYYEKGAKYRQIVIEKHMIWEMLGDKPDIFALENYDFKQNLQLLWSGTLFLTEVAFNNSEVQDFIKNDHSHYDLIIVELFHQESLYMFKHKYKAPMIGISTMGFTQFIGDFIGNPLVLPYMSHEFLNFGNELTFYERLKNIYVTYYDLLLKYNYMYPKHQLLAENNFDDLEKPLPQITDLEKEFSMVFINTHYSYDVVRPYVPGLVEIGGVHITKPKKLPDDIQQFLDGAIEGAIFFSFGSNIQCKDMPKDKIQILMNVFRKTKLRVLWKWEDDHMTNKPDNVMIGKWLPQNDILAHPNVKIFMGHGGLLSTQEAIYHGVPVIGFPFYADQHLNIKKAVKTGYALKLGFMSLTEQILTDAINKLITDPQYKEKAQELSLSFRDRPLSAMDNTMYWIEYVIRHKGARFLKSPLIDIPFYIYYMLDILLFATFSLMVALSIVIYTFKCICRKNYVNKSKNINKKIQ